MHSNYSGSLIEPFKLRILCKSWITWREIAHITHSTRSTKTCFQFPANYLWLLVVNLHKLSCLRYQRAHAYSSHLLITMPDRQVLRDSQPAYNGSYYFREGKSRSADLLLCGSSATHCELLSRASPVATQPGWINSRYRLVTCVRRFLLFSRG